MAKKSEQKPDKRKVPEIFRAVCQRYGRTYYGRLVDDDGYKVVFFGVSTEDGAHFKERSLEKDDYRFTKIDKATFDIKVRAGLFNMGKDHRDQQFEVEALEYRLNYAKNKFDEIMKGL